MAAYLKVSLLKPVLYHGSVDVNPWHARHAPAIDDVRQDIVALLTRQSCAGEFDEFPLDQYLSGPPPPFASWERAFSLNFQTSTEGGA